MQAIMVKFLSPTNTKGSRIKAICQGGSVTLSRNNDIDNDGDQAMRAAYALCDKLGWGGELAGGCVKGGEWAFVFTNYGKHSYKFTIEAREARL